LTSVATIESIIANGFANVTIAASPLGSTLNFGGVTLTGIVSIDGGAGSDTITGSTAADRITGGAGIDTLNGDNGDDVIVGGADDDTLNGQGGNDTFQVGPGDGFDDISGNAGATDTIIATADNTVIGLRSIATVEAVTAGGRSGVTIAGNGAANVLNFGGVTLTGIGSIDGAGGDDNITGTAAADLIIGGAGADLMNGGAGLNTFKFAAGFGADIINGFDANPNAPGQDRLDISALGITAATFGANVAIAAAPVVAGQPAGTQVTIGGNTIRINGVGFPGTVANQITIADFILA